MSSTVLSLGVMTPGTLTEADPIERWLDSSRGGINNPTYTVTSSEIGGTSNGFFGLTRKSDPHHNGKYLIHDFSRGRVLTCHDGHLRLEPMDLKKPQRYISELAQWEYNERNGFRGFKNIAEGTFLGHDFWWDFYTKVYHHRGWEDFTLRHMEDGLYLIQTLDLWKQRQVSAKEDGNGLFREDDGGGHFVGVHQGHVLIMGYTDAQSRSLNSRILTSAINQVQLYVPFSSLTLR